MPTIKLTDVTIRNLAPPENGQVTHWDTSLPGFGIRVSQGGTKTFVVIHGVTRKRHSIGRFGTLTLKQARDEAKRLQAALVLGMVEEKSSITFEEAKKRFLEACKTKNRPRTVYDYTRHLRRHFAFGKTKMADIKRANIQKCIERLKGTPSEQHHAFVTVKIFFNWAVQEELIDANPIANMKVPKRTSSRERVLTDAELKEVFRVAKDHPWPFGAIVRLLILTGQRRGEIGGLKWDWINLDEQLITIPAENTKNRQTHRFPIADATATLLKSLPEMGDYVFPARHNENTHFNGWGKCKAQFDKKLLGVEPYTLHDLRRTFSSNLARLGTPIHVTEKLLNHKSGAISGVAAVYNRHSYMLEMQAALSKLNRLID